MCRQNNDSLCFVVKYTNSAERALTHFRFCSSLSSSLSRFVSWISFDGSSLFTKRLLACLDVVGWTSIVTILVQFKLQGYRI